MSKMYNYYENSMNSYGKEILLDNGIEPSYSGLSIPGKHS